MEDESNECSHICDVPCAVPDAFFSILLVPGC